MLPACFLLFAGGLFGQSNAEPGKTDPVGNPSRYTLFPDQSVLAFVPGGPMASTLNPRLYRTSGNPQLRVGNVTALPSQPWNPAPIAAAAGRILTPNNDQVVYARRSATNVEVNFVDQPSTQTTYLPRLADRLPQNTDFIAIAAGDLDKAADAQHNYHDEVVVAYATPGTDKQLNLSVLNYTDGSTPVVTTLNTFGPQKDIFQLTPSIGDSTQGGVLPFDNVVGVAIGDFDNDGHNEIAVAYVARRPYLEIDTYRYVSDGNGGHSLTIVGLAAFTMQQNSLPLLGAISVKAGDFNGDGIAELAVGWGYWQGDSRLPSSTPALTIFQFGGSNGLTAFKMGSAYAPSVSAPQLPRVQVASGQFFFNPPSIPFGRQQVVLAWNDVPRGGATMQLYQVSDDLKSLALSSGTTTVLSRPASYPPLQVFSVVAGGFMGNSNPKQPTASLALSFWADYGNYVVATIAVAFNPKPPLQVLSVADLVAYPTGGVDPTSRMPLVACDWDGKSVYLGAPAHITIQDAVSTDFILEEPPKHAYFDEDKKQVVTVTRLDSNNVHLNNGQTDKFSGTSTDHTNWAIGGSLAVSAGATIGAGLDIGIVKGSAEASIDVTARGSYDYDQKKTTYNSQYASRGIDSTGQTDHDDFLKGRSESFDVWRYRIYSLNRLSPQTNNFYDVILPGPTTPFSGGGLNSSWYQPIHENGNILSYPAALGRTPRNPYLPSDLGTFKLPNGNTGSGPQVPASLNYFDGTGGSSTLRYSSEVASGGSFEYSHALAESLDIKASAKASVAVRGISAEACISAEAEFHNSNSWGGKSTNDIATSSLTQITLNRSSGNGNETYPFYPVIYSTTDGTVKMRLRAAESIRQGIQ